MSGSWQDAPLIAQQSWQDAPLVPQVPAGGLQAPKRVTAYPEGMVEPGTQNPFDYEKYPQVRNPDGSFSNVRTASYNIEGQEVLLPTMLGGKHLRKVKPDGSIDDSEVIEHYRKTGEHFGIFDSPDTAQMFADEVEGTMQRREAPPPSTSYARTALNSSAVGRVMQTFGRGLASPFELEEGRSYGLSPEAFAAMRKTLKGSGQSAVPFVTDTLQAFNEGLISFAASELDFLMRGLYAPFVGLSQGLGQISEETGIATSLGYTEHPGVQGKQVAEDILGAVETIPLVMGVQFPESMAGAGIVRRNRIAQEERLRPSQIPSKEPRAAPRVEPQPLEPPEVIQVPPGGFHAAAKGAEKPAGPAVQIGEQAVTFPDDAHAALFEYGEKLSFGEADDAFRAKIAAQGIPGESVDRLAASYYERVAAKVEEGAGPVDAGQIADTIKSAEAPVLSFTTAKGSRYTVGEGGRTTRDKAYRPEHGAKEQGPQPTSQRTFYVTDEEADALSLFQTQGESKAIVQHSSGRFGVQYLSGKDAGKFERRTLVEPKLEPKVGLTPVEIWNDGKRVHFGNKITSVSREASPTQALDYGAANRVVTTAAAEEARSILKAKVERLNVGVDPEAISAGIKLAIYHVEAGAREFAAFSKAVLADVGKWAKPYLKEWYEKAITAISEFAVDEYGGSLPRSQRIKAPPPEMLKPNRAGNINLDRIAAGDDVLDVIRGTAEINAGFPDARRGSMTFEDIQNLADAAGINPKVLAKAKVGRAFNAEEAVALRDYFVASAAKVQELSRTVLGGSDEQLLEFERALATHTAIQEKVAGMTAEAGRALASFNIKAEATEKAKAIAAVLEGRGGRATIEEKAAAIRSLNDPSAISRAILKMRDATTLDMVLEAWINGLLSGPATHATNMVSNTLTNIANIIEMGGAAGVGTLREALGIGIGEEKVLLGEMKSRMFAMMHGAKEGVVAAGTAFSEDGLGMRYSGPIDLERRRSIPGAAGRVIRVPGRLLEAEDAFFKTLSKRQEISALAYRKATGEGLTGRKLASRIAELTAEPTKAMLESAQKTGEYLTFTKPLGRLGKLVQAGLNYAPGFKFLVPFTRTPTNIVKFAGERTVLGVFSKQVRANLSGANGRVAQDAQIARMAIGSAIAISAFTLASEGSVTGGGPRDPAARALLYQTGWLPYSIRVGDTYYNYLRALGSYGVLLGIAADANEISRDISVADAGELGKLVFASATQNLINQTSLQGPTGFMQAVTDPTRYGEPWVAGMAASFVPAGVAQTARANDPYLREARGLVDGLKARIPGLSQTLIPRVDLWGNDIVREGSLGPDLASPILINRVKDDLVSREMLRLGIWKAPVERNIRGVDLTKAQYHEFAKVAGQLAYFATSQIVATEGWGELPAFAQKEMLENAFDASREAARGYSMVSDPDFLYTLLQARIDEITGMPPKAGLVTVPAMPSGQ